MNAKHTTEPWHATVWHRKYVLTATAPETHVRVAIFHGPSAETNRDRAAVCVNALAGIPDPAEAIRAAREALERSLSYLSSYPGHGADDCYEQARRALSPLSKGGAR